MPRVALLLILLIAPSRRLWAYSEDLCFREKGGGRRPRVENCQSLDTHQTWIEAFYSFVHSTLLPWASARSVYHMDATYLLAQAAGAPPETAYWLAAFDEAVDLGTYRAIDSSGNPLARWTTPKLTDAVRTSAETAGTLFHFVPPYLKSDDGERSLLDALGRGSASKPVIPEHEMFLRSLRAWAFGEAPDFCRGGLPTYFCSGENRDRMKVRFKIRAFLPFYTFSVSSRPIRLSSDPLSESQAAIAKFAIYLHSLADRIAHAPCLDTSPLAWTGSGAFLARMENEHCSLAGYSSGHAETIGHANLPSTSATVLTLVDLEIRRWLGGPGASFKTSAASDSSQALISDLLRAFKESDAAMRLLKIDEVRERNGLKGLPGWPGWP